MHDPRSYRIPSWDAPVQKAVIRKLYFRFVVVRRRVSCCPIEGEGFLFIAKETSSFNSHITAESIRSISWGDRIVLSLFSLWI